MDYICYSASGDALYRSSATGRAPHHENTGLISEDCSCSGSCCSQWTSSLQSCDVNYSLASESWTKQRGAQRRSGTALTGGERCRHMAQVQRNVLTAGSLIPKNRFDVNFYTVRTDRVDLSALRLNNKSFLALWLAACTCPWCCCLKRYQTLEEKWKWINVNKSKQKAEASHCTEVQD